MTKKEIVKSISERANLTQLKTKEIVQWTFDAIIATLVTEGRIELRNFGVFEVRQRKARKARNPRTGEAVDVQPKNVVNFQPGKEMEIEVRKAKVATKKRKTRKPAAEPVAAGANHSPTSNHADLDSEPLHETTSAESPEEIPLKPR
ncbi:HU family DNA-binding protein [Limnoglobus roseus]|uniref:Integration host factor subunit beta n=1 Tax=Limnoglobus roseus TaxID=2598579 RepID=A0A5C1AJY8_9BACT|nr:HU family DNA-binding protein [Limnoglobus roseus]QEL18487.1 integration host factor subunit beta [Limnoglobus roseus]